MADLEAVIFDWGGTLTPWHTVDAVQIWERWRSWSPLIAPPSLPESCTRPRRSSGIGPAPTGGAAGSTRCSLQAASRCQRRRWPGTPSSGTRTPSRPGRSRAPAGTARTRTAHRRAVEHAVDPSRPRGSVRSGWRTRPHRRRGLYQRDPVDQAASRSVPSSARRGGRQGAGACGVRRRPAVRRHPRRPIRRHAHRVRPAQHHPERQRGSTEGTPDAVVQRLADVLDVVDGWRAA